MSKSFLKIVSCLTILLSTHSAFAALQVQTEEECLQTQKGTVCSMPVSSQKTGTQDIKIHCGDSVVYGDSKTREMISAHVKDGTNVILTQDKEYKDGYCY